MPISQNQYLRHPTHSSWSCHIYKWRRRFSQNLATFHKHLPLHNILELHTFQKSVFTAKWLLCITQQHWVYYSISNVFLFLYQYIVYSRPKCLGGPPWNGGGSKPPGPLGGPSRGWNLGGYGIPIQTGKQSERIFMIHMNMVLCIFIFMWFHLIN